MVVPEGEFLFSLRNSNRLEITWGYLFITSKSHVSDMATGRYLVLALRLLLFPSRQHFPTSDDVGALNQAFIQRGEGYRFSNYPQKLSHLARYGDYPSNSGAI